MRVSKPKQAGERPFAMNLTTRADAVAALRAHYMPELLKVEDLEAFESIVASNGKSLLAGVMAACLAGFDESLRGSMPRGWSAHHRARRKLATLVGPVEFERTVFVDEFGRRRALLDELLSIPPRSRLSPGAFLRLVGRAAEESYRKTAAAFLAETGCRVSHVAVMGCVRRAAELLRRREPPASGRISQPTLFLEVDGLWVHLQSPEHRDEALPRFLYEQARKAASFELKLAALYAGKKEVAPGRYERGDLRLTCADLPPQGFWNEVWAMLSAEYDPDDVGTLWVGADGGKWCGPGRIAEMAPEPCRVRGVARPVPRDAEGLQGLPRRAAPRVGGGARAPRPAAAACPHVRARFAQDQGRQAPRQGPRPARVHAEQRRLRRVPERVHGHHGGHERLCRRSQDERARHVVVAKGRRGDVPGQVRDRRGTAARCAEVPRALLEEGGEGRREVPGQEPVARPRVVRVGLGSAAPGGLATLSWTVS